MLLDETIIPRSVHNICKAAANAHPNSASAAVDEALSAVMVMPDFNDFVESFTKMAVRCIVSELRHKSNVAISCWSVGAIPVCRIMSELGIIYRKRS